MISDSVLVAIDDGHSQTKFYAVIDGVETEEWLRNITKSFVDERTVDSRFPDFANTSVGCTSWIVK